jgi:hypothetical protein
MGLLPIEIMTLFRGQMLHRGKGDGESGESGDGDEWVRDGGEGVRGSTD